MYVIWDKAPGVTLGLFARNRAEIVRNAQDPMSAVGVTRAPGAVITPVPSDGGEGSTWGMGCRGQNGDYSEWEVKEVGRAQGREL